MNGSTLSVLLKGRMALGDRDEAGFESKGVGDEERHHPEQRVRQDVDRDEQPVVALYHRVSCGRASNSFTAAVTPVRNRSKPNCSACARMAALS